MRRTIFYVSDGTGITAETIGHSVLTQFDGVAFETFRIPFVDDDDKARHAALRIKTAYAQSGVRPIVVNTIMEKKLSDIVADSGAFMLDVFAPFIGPLEIELDAKRSPRVGKAHGLGRFRRVRSAHQRDQLRADARRRHRRELRRRGSDPDRRLARRQDADLPVHGAALWREGGELSSDRRGSGTTRAAQAPGAVPKAPVRPHDRGAAPGPGPRSASGRAASTRRSTNAAGSSRRPTSCSAAKASRCRTRRTRRSRKSRARSSPSSASKSTCSSRRRDSVARRARAAPKYVCSLFRRSGRAPSSDIRPQPWPGVRSDAADRVPIRPPEHPQETVDCRRLRGVVCRRADPGVGRRRRRRHACRRVQSEHARPLHDRAEGPAACELSREYRGLCRGAPHPVWPPHGTHRHAARRLLLAYVALISQSASAISSRTCPRRSAVRCLFWRRCSTR